MSTLLFIACLIPVHALGQCGNISNRNMDLQVGASPRSWQLKSGKMRIERPQTFPHISASPQGKNFLWVQASNRVGAKIETKITNLIPGNTYTLSWYAAIEKALFNSSYSTTGYFVNLSGIKCWFHTEKSNWRKESLIFTARNKTETLVLTFPHSSHLLLDGFKLRCGGEIEPCPSLTQGKMIGVMNKAPHGWKLSHSTGRLISKRYLNKLEASPQGGAVLLLKRQHPTTSAARTKIYGLTPGASYTLTFYAGVEERLFGATNKTATFEIELAGKRTQFNANSNAWSRKSLDFVAQKREESLIVWYKKQNPGNARMLLDGVKISCKSPCDLKIPSYTKK